MKFLLSILNFGEKLRIFGSNGKAQTFSPEEFHMVENHDDSFANKLLSYLKEISQYTSSEKNNHEEGGQFVQEAFSRVKWIV